MANCEDVCYHSAIISTVVHKLAKYANVEVGSGNESSKLIYISFVFLHAEKSGATHSQSLRWNLIYFYSVASKYLKYRTLMVPFLKSTNRNFSLSCECL